MDFNELKNKADEFRKNKQYENAMDYYRQCWENHRKSCDEWVGWGYAYSLRKLEKYDQALNISREVYKIKPDFDLNNNVYAWCIYYTEIKKEKISDSQTYEKAARGILKLSKPDDKYSPYLKTVFQVLDHFRRPDFNAQKVLEWTDYLIPENLSNEPGIFTAKDGKNRAVASDLENYFAIRSEALLQLGKYNECIELCNQALNTINKFHYSNDVWFRRRIANSYAGLGNLDEALKMFNSLLIEKKEWFIQKEIADLFFKKNKTDDALQYAVDSALNSGDWDKKINLYILMTNIFESKGQQDLAKLHVELVISIKQQMDWKIKDTDVQQMKKFNIDSNKQYDYKQIYNTLHKEWEKIKYKSSKRSNGVIKTILPNNKSGFIRSDDGNEYYFASRDVEGRMENIKENDRVSFYIEEGFDKKKGKSSPVAVKIKKND